MPPGVLASKPCGGNDQMFTFTGLSANSPFFLVGFFFTGFLSLLVIGKNKSALTSGCLSHYSKILT